MRRLLAIFFIALLALTAAENKRKGPKPPQVEIVEVTARRTAEGTIEIDGQVRNGGEKPIRSLRLLFHILEAGQRVITTQKGTLEERWLEPGQVAEFHWRMRDAARGVGFRVGATDHSGADLPVAKAGPYPIE